MLTSFANDRLFQNFERITQLGQGNQAVVYLARNKSTQEKAAIKIISGKARDQQVDLLHEYLVLKSLRHPSIPSVIGWEDSGIEVAMALEYIGGQDLSMLLNQPIRELEIRDIVIRIASALSHSHEMGIVHGDIKLENILLTHDASVVKIVDWGLSMFLPGFQTNRNDKPNNNNVILGAPSPRASPRISPRTSSLLQHRLGGGSPAYSAPEVFVDGEGSTAADVWGLGVIAYFLFSHRLPFNMALPYSLRYQRLDPLPDQLSIGTKRIVRKMLEINPSSRPSSADVACLSSWNDNCDENSGVPCEGISGNSPRSPKSPKSSPHRLDGNIRRSLLLEAIPEE
eukprot:TRINITY_DN6428_c0_g1_i1.p1 TRINITY_DN6428_c0_g1~~TRINITY_DN6428_c0_g1_i1.p1  ORF type:complete len:341 (-),score=47.94 TRINITY_DN6428_c0_g1_i1:46-1068(-)